MENGASGARRATGNLGPSLASLGRSRCTGDAGTGPTGRRCPAQRSGKKSQQPKPLRCHVGPWMQSECRECMSVSMSLCVCARRKKAALCILGSVRRRVSRGAVTAPRATRRDSSALFFRTLSKPTCAGLSSSSWPRRRLTPVVPLSARTPSTLIPTRPACIVPAARKGSLDRAVTGPGFACSAMPRDGDQTHQFHQFHQSGF